MFMCNLGHRLSWLHEMLSKGDAIYFFFIRRENDRIIIFYYSVADPQTKISGARPLRDPMLSFLHTFSLKSARVKGPLKASSCPPPEKAR